MKKFSTASLFLALACSTAPAFSAAAEKANGGCRFLDNAPDQHQVTRGDTLWGISSRFLEHPWCWPQVWGLNKEQIRDPHWIYPGQVVVFDRASGRLRLAGDAGAAGGVPTVRLSPNIRAQQVQEQAIPAIPGNVIEPFLTEPLIVEDRDISNAPRIVHAAEGHVFLGKGDRAYVRGNLEEATTFQVYRPGAALRDPDTGTVLGHEATYLGVVKLDRAARAEDEAHRFIVLSSKQEIGAGARLVPLAATPVNSYVPHRPSSPVQARIMSVYGGVSNAGQNAVVTVNRGKEDGLDPGSVLELYQHGKTIRDQGAGNQLVKLPEEKYGSLFIFRSFSRISYGLVMQVTEPVQVGDPARSPE